MGIIRVFEKGDWDCYNSAEGWDVNHAPILYEDESSMNRIVVDKTGIEVYGDNDIWKMEIEFPTQLAALLFTEKLIDYVAKTPYALWAYLDMLGFEKVGKF